MMKRVVFGRPNTRRFVVVLVHDDGEELMFGTNDSPFFKSKAAAQEAIDDYMISGARDRAEYEYIIYERCKDETNCHAVFAGRMLPPPGSSCAASTGWVSHKDELG